LQDFAVSSGYVAQLPPSSVPNIIGKQSHSTVHMFNGFTYMHAFYNKCLQFWQGFDNGLLPMWIKGNHMFLP